MISMPRLSFFLSFVFSLFAPFFFVVSAFRFLFPFASYARISFVFRPLLRHAPFFCVYTHPLCFI